MGAAASTAGCSETARNAGTCPCESLRRCEPYDRRQGRPRPIKMGEFLRSAYAKRLVNLSQVHLRTKTLRMHQWGVNLPGACEALCHWRGTIEPLVLNGDRAAGGGRPGPCQHVWQC